MDPEFKHNYRFNPKSNRLQGYNYSSNGGYFITLCTNERKKYFGEIIDGKMNLNEYGKITKKCWLDILKHFTDVIIDEFIIMPNHIHGIIIINNNENPVETKNLLSLISIPKNPLIPNGTSRTIGSIIRGFKIGVTKYMRENTDIYKIWQSNYHDKIIRNDEQLNKAREYIINNPLKWELDLNNPKNIKN